MSENSVGRGLDHLNFPLPTFIMEENKDQNIIETIKSGGIDFNNLNFPYKRKTSTVRRPRREVLLDDQGRHLIVCESCGEYFPLLSPKSEVKKCHKCSLKKLKCQFCGEEFLSKSHFARFCSKHTKPSNLKTMRKLIRLFKKDNGFLSENELIFFLMKFYLKHKEQAEKEREIYRAVKKLQAEEEKKRRQDISKEILRKKMNPEVDLSSIKSIN